MKILIGGASGLIGQALTASLTADGHEVVRLVRPSSQRSGTAATRTADWDPAAGNIADGALEGVDAVVNLAGENLASGRWTESKKRRLVDSRTVTSRLLAEAIARHPSPPKVFLCSSAIGIYGDHGDAVVTEGTRKGEGFLADLCAAWEDSARPAAQAGTRVANLRFGVVLSPEGGALAKMLPVFKLGAGGVLGDGMQYMSWVGLDDAVRAAIHVLTADGLDGPVNVTSPHPVTNRDFTKTLGRVLGRPTALPVPGFALKAALGKEMAEEALLASQRVSPKRLLETGYAFTQPDLEGALRAMLGR